MSKFGRRGKRPDGYGDIEPILDALEVELRESEYCFTYPYSFHERPILLTHSPTLYLFYTYS